MGIIPGGISIHFKKFHSETSMAPSRTQGIAKASAYRQHHYDLPFHLMHPLRVLYTVEKSLFLTKGGIPKVSNGAFGIVSSQVVFFFHVQY